jgi:hypothetical protein
MLTEHSYTAFDYFSPFVKPIRGNVKELWSFFETIQVDYGIVSMKDRQKTLSYQSVANQPFIDEHLKQDILLLTNYRDITIRSGEYTFHLHIHYLRQDTLDTLIETLAYALSFTSLVGPHKMKDITMTYYLLDVKRVLDGDTFFDKEEVNGGACWSSPTECDIVVWRKEEILKVTIHELIHGLSYDYKQDTPDIIQHYQSRYGITSPKMNTFEAYTELFAELIHSYLLAKFIHTAIPSSDCYKLYSTFVGVEIQFSNFQSTKVLDLLALDKDVNKETNVTAYYLIKTELYNDLSNFLKFCMVHNERFIKLKDTSKYIDYLKGVKKLLPKQYTITSSYLQNTTRMTCLELDLF